MPWRLTKTIEANILDDPQEGLDPAVFDNPNANAPRPKDKIRHWVKRKIYNVFRDNDYPDPDKWLSLILTGSLTTYQWSASSDFDVEIWVDTDNLPDWKRAEMIALMQKTVEGVNVPGTTHTLGIYVMPSSISEDDHYRPGLRSAFDLDRGRWLVLPEKSRVHDVATEFRPLLAYARMVADKMKLLMIYDPPGAVEYNRQLLHRWRRDHAANKGDYSASNIVHKYLDKYGLVPHMPAEKTSKKAGSKFITAVSKKRYKRLIEKRGPVKAHRNRKIAMPVDPSWWDDYVANNPYSYHVHKGDAHDEIMRGGILPYGDLDSHYQQGGYGGIENHPRVSHAYAAASPGQYEPSSDTPHTVFQVDNSQLDPENIDLDEDWLYEYHPEAQRDREQYRNNGGRGGWIADHPEADKPETVADSINRHRTFAVRGGIPAHALDIHSQSEGQCEEYDYEYTESDNDLHIVDMDDVLDYYDKISGDQVWEFFADEDVHDYDERNCIAYQTAGASISFDEDSVINDILENLSHADTHVESLARGITLAIEHARKQGHLHIDLQTFNKFLRDQAVSDDDSPRQTETLFDVAEYGEYIPPSISSIMPYLEEYAGYAHDPNMPNVYDPQSNDFFTVGKEVEKYFKHKSLYQDEHEYKFKIGDRVQDSYAYSGIPRRGEVVQLGNETGQRHSSGRIRVLWDDQNEPTWEWEGHVKEEQEKTIEETGFKQHERAQVGNDPDNLVTVDWYHPQTDSMVVTQDGKQYVVPLADLQTYVPNPQKLKVGDFVSYTTYPKMTGTITAMEPTANKVTWYVRVQWATDYNGNPAHDDSSAKTIDHLKRVDKLYEPVEDTGEKFAIGDRVKVKDSTSSLTGLKGKSGIVEMAYHTGQYLVSFEDGKSYKMDGWELERDDSSNPSSEPDQKKLNPGDRVKVINPASTHFGTEGTVKMQSNGNYGHYVDVVLDGLSDHQSMAFARDELEVTLYKPDDVTPEKKPPPKFEMGDIVMSLSGSTEGEIGCINYVENPDYENSSYRVNFVDNETAWFYGSDLLKSSAEELEKAIEKFKKKKTKPTEYKMGDKVVLTPKSGTVGKGVGTVYETPPEHAAYVEVKFDDGSYYSLLPNEIKDYEPPKVDIPAFLDHEASLTAAHESAIMWVPVEDRSIFWERTARDPVSPNLLFSDDDPEWEWYKWGYHPDHGTAVWQTSSDPKYPSMDGVPIHQDQLPQMWPGFPHDALWSPQLLAGRFPVDPATRQVDPSWAEAEDLAKLDPAIKDEIFRGANARADQKAEY